MFGYFGSKAGLFLAAYQAAARSFRRYLDAPPEVIAGGFFAVVSHWIARTPDLIHGNWLPYRVTLLGNYCSSLQLRREITQFLLREDPYGTQEFVQFGIDRGEVRTDIDPDGRVHGRLADGPLPGRDRHRGTRPRPVRVGGVESAAARDLRVRQFVELLRGAIGTRP